MKKSTLAFVASLLALLLVLAPTVDAGVGNSKSGGSRKSGGSNRSGRSSWSGGSDRSGRSSWSGGTSSYSSSSESGAGLGSSGALGVVAIVAVGGIFFRIVKGMGGDIYSSNDVEMTTEERVGRQIQNNQEAIRELKRLDPYFDEESFLSQAKAVYLHLQSAWTEKDWASVRNLESQSLYEQHRTQLQEHIRAKTTNVLERVCVEDSKIKDFYPNPQGHDRLEVILSSTMRDYIKDDETGRIIEGDPSKELFTVYRMNFIRVHGAQTEGIAKDDVSSDHCPNCGAPLTIDSGSKCEYCQASLIRTAQDWVLDTYDVVDEIEFYK